MKDDRPGKDAIERALFSIKAAAPYCESHGSPIIAGWLQRAALELTEYTEEAAMIVNLDTHRQLKALRDRLHELTDAIETFEGDLAELGVLRAKFYATSYRAAELQREIKSGDDQ